MPGRERSAAVTALAFDAETNYLVAGFNNEALHAVSRFPQLERGARKQRIPPPTVFGAHAEAGNDSGLATAYPGSSDGYFGNHDGDFGDDGDGGDHAMAMDNAAPWSSNNRPQHQTGAFGGAF